MKNKSEVEVILSGGLGNQLFQYAFGRWLSLQRNSDLLLNTYRLNLKIEDETVRSFALDAFKISSSILSKTRLPGKTRIIDYFLRKVNLFRYGFERNTNNASIVWGHWLDMKYADEVRSYLLKEIVLKESLSSHDSNLFEECTKKRVLSVHVRRGDYVTSNKARTHHGVLEKDYYMRAIKKAREMMEVEEVWFFSDDPGWCSANFPEDKVVRIESANPAVDMILMSKCKGNIISNSTFSWWAAWLNDNPNKIVVIPSNWFGSSPNPNLYPDIWVKLDNVC